MRNYLVVKDGRRRKLYLETEYKRKLYKALLLNRSITKELRFKLMLKMDKLAKNSGRVRIQNRCIATGRSKACFRFVKLTRMQFRLLASNGKLFGIRQSSW